MNLKSSAIAIRCRVDATNDWNPCLNKIYYWRAFVLRGVVAHVLALNPRKDMLSSAYFFQLKTVCSLTCGDEKDIPTRLIIGRRYGPFSFKLV